MAQGEKAQGLLDALEQRQAQERPELEIVDVEIVGASKAPTVRVFIDKADGSKITLDELTEQSSWVSLIVEELDPFKDSYNLEVSSPGVDRPLRKASDFKRFISQRCEVTTTAHEGRKKWTGSIVKVDDTSLCLDVDGEQHSFDLSEIKKAHLKAELNFKPAQKG